MFIFHTFTMQKYKISAVESKKGKAATYKN